MYRRGNLYSEALIYLIVLSLFMPFIYQCIKISSSYDFNYHLQQDEIATLQLRRLLALAYDKRISPTHLTLNYLGKDYTLEYKNNSLQLRPGTQIFYDDLLNASFFAEDGVIFVRIDRENEYLCKALCKEESFDFSTLHDCAYDDIDPESSLSKSSKE